MDSARRFLCTAGLPLAALLALPACVGEWARLEAPDAGCTRAPDSGATVQDSGARDSGPLDSGPLDAGPLDAGRGDSGATGDAGGLGASDGGWRVLYHEDFETLSLGAPAWQTDPVPDDGPFSDHGVYFQNQGVTPPAALRTSWSFGQDGWLTAESYTRSGSTSAAALASVIADPNGSSNHVLRVSSPRHTDATVIRSSQPLPPRYRVRLKVGFADFGDGLPGLNGYQVLRIWLAGGVLSRLVDGHHRE